MRTRDFSKRISHLTQEQALTGAIDSLNRLLAQKGIVTRKELQDSFLAWMKRTNLGSKKYKRKKKKKNRSGLEYRVLQRLLKWYIENELDQWNLWEYDTKYGKVWVHVTRRDPRNPTD